MRDRDRAFTDAQEQFDTAADLLGLDTDLKNFLRWPMREYVFTVPVRMDDGQTQVFRGYRIQYNDARGPCCGGLRWHADENPAVGRAMAAGMTWRTALMDLPLGGACGGLICDSKKLTVGEKERAARGWMRAMAHNLGEHSDILTPDIYTPATTMAWLLDEFEAIVGRSHPAVITGKPVALGGSQGRGDATARGGIYLVREALRRLKIEPQGAYAIQGFGNAGQHVALLHPQILGGGRLLAVSDSGGGVLNRQGLDPQALVAYKQRTGGVTGFPDATPISNEDLLELSVDVLYPAALEGVITGTNAEQINARIVCELADGAITPEADKMLFLNEVHVIPDFLANAGSVSVSYFEQVQGAGNFYWPESRIHQLLDERVTRTYADVWQLQRQRNMPFRMTAFLLAITRVAEAVKLRGWV